MRYWQPALHTVVMYLALLVLTRWEGKKQVSQLTFFHYITGITIGSIAANGITGNAQTFLSGLIGMTGWAALTVLTDLISFKNRRAHRLINDESTMIIDHGKILEQNMAKTRMNMDDLRTMLRGQNIFRFADVEFAALETSGKLSVQKMPWAQNLTRQDVGVNLTRSAPGIELINDGIIDYDKLQEIGRDAHWLQTHFEKMGVSDLRKVTYAELYPNGQLYFDLKEPTDDGLNSSEK